MYFSVVTSAGNADAVPNTVLVESPTEESKVEKTGSKELQDPRHGIVSPSQPRNSPRRVQLWRWVADDGDDPRNPHA